MGAASAANQFIRKAIAAEACPTNNRFSYLPISTVDHFQRRCFGYGIQGIFQRRAQVFAVFDAH